MKKIGLIGLGKMGLNLAQNMLDNKFEIVGFDINPENVDSLVSFGGQGANSLEDLVDKLPEQKIIWVMVPSGKVTEETIGSLSKLLKAEDIIIDGGNSNYNDSLKNYHRLKDLSIDFLDVGTSGGISGARNGANLMIGGDKNVFDKVEWIFEGVAQKDGYLYVGEAASGHYLKMVHNGIEYGMMQAIGEGFDLLEHSPYEYDYEKVANLWNNGSVIRSWLIEIAADAFKEDPNLDEIEGVMYSSGEGKWMVEDALDRQVSIPVITTSLMMRYRSLEKDTFTGKVVASLRKGFGGHDVKKTK